MLMRTGADGQRSRTGERAPSPAVRPSRPGKPGRTPAPTDPDVKAFCDAVAEMLVEGIVRNQVESKGMTEASVDSPRGSSRNAIERDASGETTVRRIGGRQQLAGAAERVR